MIWEKEANEPERWYNRFNVYLSLGPSRTIDGAYRQSVQFEKLKGKSAGANWYAAAKAWNWKERAKAYDAVERDRLRAQEEDRRFDAREHRLVMIDQLLDSVYNVLVSCNLDDLDPELARAWLPTLRIMFKDLLSAQRYELGLPSVAEDSAGENGLGSSSGTIPPFTADELAQAQRQLKAWRRQNQSSHTDLRNCLANLYPDESSARRIADQAGLDLSRIAFGPLALNNWHAIINEADHASLVDDLIAAARKEYPNNPDLAHAIQQEELNK